MAYMTGMNNYEYMASINVCVCVRLGWGRGLQTNGLSHRGNTGAAGINERRVRAADFLNSNEVV